MIDLHVTSGFKLTVESRSSCDNGAQLNRGTSSAALCLRSPCPVRVHHRKRCSTDAVNQSRRPLYLAWSRLCETVLTAGQCDYTSLFSPGAISHIVIGFLLWIRTTTWHIRWIQSRMRGFARWNSLTHHIPELVRWTNRSGTLYAIIVKLNFFPPQFSFLLLQPFFDTPPRRPPSNIKGNEIIWNGSFHCLCHSDTLKCYKKNNRPRLGNEPYVLEAKARPLANVLARRNRKEAANWARLRTN